MAEEVDDYMSDVFLTENNDVKPGLINSRSIKRAYEMDSKKIILDEENRQKNLPLSEVESKRRNLGLNEPLNNDNKGFNLLSKMGFEPGKGLGKDGDGRVEPVTLSVKKDRQGLGLDSEIKEKLENLINNGKEESVEDYRSRLKDKNDEKQIEKDLFLSQRMCRQFDLSHGLSQPDEKWFWPIEKKPEECDDNSDDESETDLSVNEKLHKVTEYLRDVYNFCQWCGVQYSGALDLSKECPGESRDVH